jgi:sugar-specific transcriptional regulator TrmB
LLLQNLKKKEVFPLMHPERLEREITVIAERLERLGLSPYEARAYVGLVMHGCADAETIASTARIPRTSAYKILEALEAEGFVIATEGRPKMYRPERPAKICERITDEIKTTFDRLEEVYEIVREKGIPQMIFTIYGREKVLDKIRELLDKSTEDFIISTPLFSEIREALGREFQSARTRGVKITVITAPNQKVPEGVAVVRRSGLIATDVVSDNERALIAAPELDACGYTDNALLAEHLQRFLEILINTYRDQEVPLRKA